jgi:hypothetical protein
MVFSPLIVIPGRDVMTDDYLAMKVFSLKSIKSQLIALNLYIILKICLCHRASFQAFHSFRVYYISITIFLASGNLRVITRCGKAICFHYVFLLGVTSCLMDAYFCNAV